MLHPNIYIGNSVSMPGDCMIVAVSDVHLGTPYCNKKLFMEFLNNVVNAEEVDHFVLVGDIFDLWRRDPLKVIFENTDVFKAFEALQETTEIHYVVGNHDYHMIELKSLHPDNFVLDTSTDVTLRSGNQSYHFVHGFQFEFADKLEVYQAFADQLCMGVDIVGSAADSIWNLFEMTSQFYDGVKKWLNIDPETLLKWPGERLSTNDVKSITHKAKMERDQSGFDVIIYGHTHHPFAEKDVANTGSWVDDPSRHMLKENTYIVIKDGELELKEYYE